MQKKPLTIQGTGLNIRRYLYGADAADGFDTLLHKGSTDFTRSLTWIPDRPFNGTDYWLDGPKLAALGWRQRVSFSEGLEASLNWYRENLDSWWPEVSETINGASTATNESHLRGPPA
ncbi:dTDP-D-glucose 4-6-dehydratase-like protein [Penicillium vulpinum]|nr:dTDP-D-glucose 4-6-dehydratase-like protein [Penicillium vulpinum]KAJ5958761.1 dTDP-D-glucose 4-6-dehydratase-like protein [Penicillium vulpinum]